MIKSVLFDLDGVIVDSEPLHFEAHRKALGRFGIHITIDDYMEFGVAKGDANLINAASEKYGVKIDREKASRLKKELYKEIFEKKASPRKGVLELIEHLGGRHVLAITSSGARDSVEFMIERLGLEKRFEAVISGDDVERVKPFPDIYEKVLNQLGLKNTDCVAIEDSESGLLAAKGAKIKCIVAPCEFTRAQNFSEADFVFKELEEITEQLIDSM